MELYVAPLNRFAFVVDHVFLAPELLPSSPRGLGFWLLVVLFLIDLFSLQETTHFGLHMYDLVFVLFCNHHDLVDILNVNFLNARRPWGRFIVFLKLLSVRIVRLVVATVLLVSHLLFTY